MSRSISEIERQVESALASELSDYSGVVARAFEQLSDALTDTNTLTAPLPPSGNVQLPILARLQGDLRACHLLAARGYAVAALNLAASIHEVGWAAMYLGADNARAKAWVEHENMKKQYPECGHRSVIEDVAPRFELTRQEIDQEYDIYKQLCLAKHGNPVLQRQYGVLAAVPGPEVQQIPYYSEATVYFCRYALLHAVRVVSACTLEFVNHHLPAEIARRHQEAQVVLSGDFSKVGKRDGLMADWPDTSASAPVQAAT